MNWWQIIRLILKYGPTAYSIIREILRLIDQVRADQPDVAAFYERRLDVQAAAAKAQKSKEPLNLLANQLRGVLSGADK